MADDVDDALAALASGMLPLKGAEDRLPRRPGLYAIYGDSKTWESLTLGKPPDKRPLYVGKSESSLLGRDIDTHFGDARTGQSTVRRSFAALLKDTLKLSGQPRNLVKPAYFSNFGLPPKDDRKLTKWMMEHLRLATWAPAGMVTLRSIEKQIIVTWQPPLNLTHVGPIYKKQVKVARKVLADEARQWAKERVFPA